MVFRLAILFSLVFVIAPMRPVSANSCPSSPQQEAGGQHTCFDAGAKGHVHLWRPSGYDASSAITVVYAHGHSIDEKGSARAQPHYVDRAWANHRLAENFSKSGLNALFVAVESPIANSDGCKEIGAPAAACSVRWTSLGDLLSTIASRGGIAPPGGVIGIGHSAGMFTIERWVNDERLAHVISLDSMYSNVPSSLASYLSRSERKVTLAGGSAQNAKMREFVQGKNFVTVNGYPSGLSEDQKNAPRLYFDSTLGHMALVTGGNVIPLVLQRSGGAAAGASPSEAAVPPRDIITPRLNVPIPDVSFSTALQSGEFLILPFIGEYVSGVYSLLVGVVGLVAGFMIILGGYQYLTAGGDASRVGAAKNRVLNALIGLALVFGSYLILYVINPNLVDFGSLQFRGTRTELYSSEDYDPGNDTVFSEGQLPEINALGFASGAVPFCTKAGGGCESFCRGLSTDRSRWPQTTPGYMPREQTEEIKDLVVGGRVVLKGNNQRAHPKVHLALRLTAEQMTKDYPARKLRIEVGECHRTIESQIEKVCDPGVGIRTKGGQPVDYGSAVANPGGSNHGVGYACDLRLFDGDEKLIVGYNTKTQCQAPVEYQRLFDAIMFKTGWVRYDREIWHYEYGTPASVPNRCGTLRFTACSYPPAHYCGKK